MVLDSDDPDTWSCGSFFTNPILSARRFADLESRVAARLGPRAPVPPRFADPDGNVKTSAAWLIDQAGFEKGFALPGSGAAISGKHTLAITNRGSATAEDVAALARHIRAGVQDAFGVSLVNEPVFVGHDL
jgi:UDP-N-acetylmuramate dehydrogenase